MYTFVKKYGNKLLVRETNNNIWRVSRVNFDLYSTSGTKKNNTGYHSVEGVPLEVLNFGKVADAQRYIVDSVRGGNTVYKVYGAKSLDYAYIRDNYKGSSPATIDDLYIANIDIETGRDEFGYSSVDEARCPITAIALQDVIADVYYVWGWGSGTYKKEDSILDLDIKYLHCASEKAMMSKFIKFISARHPDIITGWNTNKYDIPYIINRINVLWYEENEQEENQVALRLIRKLSPFGYVYEYFKKNDWGVPYKVYAIVGVSLLDYMELFMKFTFKTPENYKLNTIATMILKDEKLNYDEYKNLQDLRDNNYQLFIDYNIKDVQIVHRLDQKLRLFDLILSVAYKAGVNYTDVISPVNTWDVLIYNVLMDQNIVPQINVSEKESSSYVGAYVKEPIPGIYKWVGSFDLNSLYPHLQMGYNISPEKRVIDSEIPPELMEIRKSLGTTLEGIDRLLDEEIDTSMLKKHNMCIAPNGQFYKCNDDGFIPVILEGLYSERKAVKKSMLDDEQLLVQKKDELQKLEGEIHK